MEAQDEREDSAPGLARLQSPPMVRMPAQARTPLEMLDSALKSGMSPEVIQKLMDLSERHERNEAKRDFDRAIAGAKAKMPIITKNRRVSFASKKPGGDKTDYAYEDLAGVLETVEPVLAEFDLGVRFTSDAKTLPGSVIITCIIFHSGGHQVETSLPGPYDNSGNKNAIQAMGSTVTYLQRYTLKVALGLAAAADDDEKMMDSNQVSLLEAHVKRTGANREKFLGLLKVERFDQVPASQFDFLVRELNLVEERRKARIAEAAKVKEEEDDPLPI